VRYLKKLDPRLRKTIDWIVGLTLIAIGIVGAFVPILQGWIFVLMGLAVLSSHSRLARAIHERIIGMGRRIRRRVARSGPERTSAQEQGLRGRPDASDAVPPLE
jgi:hypothetical protein